MTDHRGTAAALAGRGVRTFVLDQRVRYSYSAPVTDLRQHLRIVPPATHGHQRRRGWQLSVEGVASWTVRTFTDRWGNETMTVTVPKVETAVEFVLHAEVEIGTGAALRSPLRRAPVTLRDTVDPRCLRPTRLTRADGPIAAMVRDLGPAGGRPVDLGPLCERVHTAIAYEWGITGVRTTASEALAGGRGVCQDYAHIMLAACRRAGIPARYVSGHLTGEGGSHAWIEVLHPVPGRPGAWTAEGWDPTHNRRTNADYLVVAVGRDYADAAPMWGTFEGDGVESTLEVEKRLSA